MKDYYYILGVTFDATAVEIKKAYRKLSLKFHPDQNDSDQFFEDRFKDILEAYETLSNPSKRASYDIGYASFFSKKKSKREECPPPKILRFESNVTTCTIDDIVRIDWETKDATDISLINIKNNLPAKGHEIIKISDLLLDGKVVIELLAVNKNGEGTNSNVIIHVNKDRSVGGNNPRSYNLINLIQRNGILIFATYILIVLGVILFLQKDKLYQYYYSEPDGDTNPIETIAENPTTNDNTYDPFKDVKPCVLTSTNLEVSMQTIYIPSDENSRHRIRVTNKKNQKIDEFYSDSNSSSTYRDWEEKIEFNCHMIKQNIIIEDFNFDNLDDIAVINRMALGNRVFHFYLQDANFNFNRDKYLSDEIMFADAFDKAGKRFLLQNTVNWGTILVTSTYEFNDYLKIWEHAGTVETEF
ncbi:DnaJ domain-containing protein [Neolewinella lacunae]|uniref:J domain-containing protein n=1 Tax=Neolewinella lacunae TaxID=1517758 RepID=A0A923T7H9_9BACT|nr:DnaJ domain-containing protein [Neolewinella lacunae]MBC6993566.1 J domain-containing protein [Neolewinella lacunae]MDN3636158.1 DnaJ domain-containing protein [Neolewinella lacunae]